MPATTKPPFKEILRRYARLKRRIWRDIGQQAVGFFKDNFSRQGFLDGGHVNKWRKRSRLTTQASKAKGRGRRAILVSTGRLRRSIRVVRWGPNFVTVGTSSKYARIHNQGGIITQKVTKRQRAFFWAMFYRTGNDAFKAAALSKTIRVRIPRRKFIGASSDLSKEIERLVKFQILKIFRK